MQAPRRHGARGEEVSREGRRRRGLQELPPGLRGPPGCGADAGVVEDLPGRARGQLVSQAGGVGGDASQVNAAGAVFDNDQGVDSPPEHGVHGDEIGREKGAGPGGRERFPGRPSTAGRGDRSRHHAGFAPPGGRDRVAGLDELAWRPPAPPGPMAGCGADHELRSRGCRGRPSGTPPAGGSPTCARPVAGARRAAPPGSPRRHPPTGGRGSPGTVPRATAGLPAGSRPGWSGGAASRSHAAGPKVSHPWTPHAGHAASDSRADAAQQADDGADHSAMISTPEHRPGHVRSSNRAPQDRRARLGRKPGWSHSKCPALGLEDQDGRERRRHRRCNKRRLWGVLWVRLAGCPVPTGLRVAPFPDGGTEGRPFPPGGRPS
jgi:hypothetical protein